ncbi:MAG TPA: ribosome-associated translation inhibitor RaiA [Candidatus Eisenbacteria bacterium]|jgi:putative sigma-54 modulation protein|nr:ribosome-associated translation inhibitor RaiA [Candidatus Eisenbacteria bacterium]
MELTIKGRHWSPSTAFRTFAVERVRKLARFYPSLIRAELTVTREGYRHHAELRLHGNGVDLLTKGEDTDPRAAVDLVVDKSERALERHKDRLKDRKKRAGARGPVLPANFEELAPLPKTRASTRVVRERAKRPAMSAEQAAKRLLKGTKPFLVFTEPDGAVRIAYRRGEGEVGVLELD